MNALSVLECSNLKEFWEYVANHFSRHGYRAVLDITGTQLLNWYIDYIQKFAIYKELPNLKDSLVIDAGCGVGRWTVRLAERGARVISFDVSTRMVSEAKKRVTEKSLSNNVDFLVASITDVPFRNDISDLCLCVTVLQHLADISRIVRAIGELKRISKKVYLLELAPNIKKPFKRPYSTIVHLPTHYWISFLRGEGNCELEYNGVDLGVFISLLDRFRNESIKKFKKPEEDCLNRKITEEIYKPSFLAIFYRVALSLAALISLPIDLAFKDLFKKYTRHKLFIVEKST